MSDPAGPPRSAGTPPPADSQRTSRTLLHLARAGQAGAWERLVLLYGPLVRHWCHRGGVPTQDMDDVAQDVFARSFASLDTFYHDRPSDTFRGWLRTITRHRIVDHYRKERRHVPAVGGSTAMGVLLNQPDLPEEADAVERDLCDQLYQNLLEYVRGEFEPRTWQMFWRTVVDDLPTAAVATELGVSTNSVRQARSRVLRRIREEVGEVDVQGR
jgi:RNA polymerase sigma-70 factor, ECF subfamily